MIKKLIIFFLLLAYIKTEAQPSVLAFADSLMQRGNYKLALEKLQQSKKPSLDQLEKIASIYQKVSNYSKAIEFYEKAYALEPSDKLKEQIGRSHQLTGNADKAIELYQEVLKANPENLLLKYALAKLYISERKVKKGIELLEELSKQDKTNPNYLYQLGVAYEKLGKKEFFNSMNSFLNAYRIDSLHLKSIYKLAKFYRDLKFKDSTTLFINKGLTINPKSINFNQLKAQDAFLNKDFETSLKHLKRLEDLGFKTKFTNELYGLVYLNLEDYKKAEGYFLKAQRMDFKDNGLRYNLGLAYEGLKDYKKAEMSYMMSTVTPKEPLDKNYLKLGMVQLVLKQPKKALRSFELGLKNNSRNHNLQYQLALVSDSYYKDKKIALKHYEKYIEKFEDKDEEQTNFVKQRIKEIKKTLFINGEKLD